MAYVTSAARRAVQVLWNDYGVPARSAIPAITDSCQRGSTTTYLGGTVKLHRRAYTAIAMLMLAAVGVGLPGAASAQSIASSQSAVDLRAAAAAEVDRVVAEGAAPPLPASQGSTTASYKHAVASEIRCATFEGLRYCLHYGWTDETEEMVVANLGALDASASAGETTGDLPIQAVVTGHAALPPSVQASRERQELRDAAAAVGKVWMIKHDVEGVPLAEGFMRNHPGGAGSVDGGPGHPGRRAHPWCCDAVAG